MAIQELKDILLPPKAPLEAGPIERWDIVQEELGCRLPDDFREFGLVYGTGRFAEQGFRVFNPFAGMFLSLLESTLDVWRSLKQAEGDEDVPFRIFPDVPGLLPWGDDEGASGLFWLTDGDPATWPVVVRSHETPTYYRFDMQLTTFLTRMMTGQIIVPNVFDGEEFADPHLIAFSPERRVFPKFVDRMSVYDLYAANGNRTNFWVFTRICG